MHDGWCLMSAVSFGWYLRVWCMMSGALDIWYLTPGMLIPGIWYIALVMLCLISDKLVSDVRCLSVWRLLNSTAAWWRRLSSDVLCVLFHVWYVMRDVWYIVYSCIVWCVMSDIGCSMYSIFLRLISAVSCTNDACYLLPACSVLPCIWLRIMCVMPAAWCLQTVLPHG